MRSHGPRVEGLSSWGYVLDMSDWYGTFKEIKVCKLTLTICFFIQIHIATQKLLPSFPIAAKGCLDGKTFVFAFARVSERPFSSMLTFPSLAWSASKL